VTDVNSQDEARVVNDGSIIPAITKCYLECTSPEVCLRSGYNSVHMEPEKFFLGSVH